MDKATLIILLSALGGVLLSAGFMFLINGITTIEKAMKTVKHIEKDYGKN